MLRIRLSELSLADRNRLGTELVAIMLRELTFPPFTDPRTGTLRTRPYGKADAQRAEQFVAAFRLEQQEQTEISSSAMAERLTDLLMQWYAAVVPSRARQTTSVIQLAATRLAVQAQRRLMAYVLDGANNGFGVAATPESWGAGAMAPPWQSIAPGTVALAVALAETRGEHAPAPVAPSLAPALEHGMSDISTQRLPVLHITPEPLPADPLPPVVAPPTAPLPRPVDVEVQSARSDKAIFAQLRQQLLASMTAAARNYRITAPPDDPAGLLAALLARGAVDESDLRLAEGILALCGKVIAAGRTDLEEYREALTLYLLFNRSRFVRA